MMRRERERMNFVKWRWRVALLHVVGERGRERETERKKIKTVGDCVLLPCMWWWFSLPLMRG